MQCDRWYLKFYDTRLVLTLKIHDSVLFSFLSLRLIAFLYNVHDKFESRYECCVIRGRSNVVDCNFLHPVITT
jgi:hypothetical protein